jgi:dTDP-glucose pyrophosphorylase
MPSEPPLRPDLLVLAAGLGSRYGGLKQIDPVGPCGETLLDYSVYDALRAGFGRVVFLIRRSIEDAFREAVGRRFEGVAEIDYAFQELDMLPPGFAVPQGRTKPWGTAHAVLCARSQVGGAFAAVNADDFYGAESFRVLADHLRSGTGEYALVGFALRKTLSEFGGVARGICKVSADGYLAEVREVVGIAPDGSHAKFTGADGEVHRLSGDATASMNLWGFTDRVFGGLERIFEGFLRKSGSSADAELYLTTAMNELIHSGEARLRVLATPETWHGVTYREDRPGVVDAIRAMISEGKYPERLWD